MTEEEAVEAGLQRVTLDEPEDCVACGIEIDAGWYDPDLREYFCADCVREM